MKKTIIIPALAILGAILVLAQTMQSPQPVDWRYRIIWTDTNAASLVASYNTYASNSVGGLRSLNQLGPSANVISLLNGAPAGTWTIWVSAVSVTGDEGSPSTNLYIIWPGGNGKLGGPVNIGSSR